MHPWENQHLSAKQLSNCFGPPRNNLRWLLVFKRKLPQWTCNFVLQNTCIQTWWYFTSCSKALTEKSNANYPHGCNKTKAGFIFCYSSWQLLAYNLCFQLEARVLGIFILNKWGVLFWVGCWDKQMSLMAS